MQSFFSPPQVGNIWGETTFLLGGRLVGIFFYQFSHQIPTNSIIAAIKITFSFNYEKDYSNEIGYTHRNGKETKKDSVSRDI